MGYAILMGLALGFGMFGILGVLMVALKPEGVHNPKGTLIAGIVALGLGIASCIGVVAGY